MPNHCGAEIIRLAKKEVEMSVHSPSSVYPVRVRRLPSAWLYARPLWAGLSIIAMWLAVSFVGIFGGNIVDTGAGGDSSSVPVVVVVSWLPSWR